MDFLGTIIKSDSMSSVFHAFHEK
uniref:Uncharacterized protein n=1 Tax=Rhizophora mucronata TaxID=61149 RepID=A0A2P2NF89_RHIMU